MEEKPSPEPAARWSRLSNELLLNIGAYLVALTLSLLLLVVPLKLWQADLHQPFIYYGEANFNALLVKTVLDHGWHLTNPSLGMPAGLDLRDVPMSDNNAHLLLIKLIGLFTKDYALVMNIFFLLTFPLTALSSLWVMRRFGVSFVSAIFASLLYTLLPFHFMRGQHHLFLAAYFIVPLAVMLVLWVASGSVSWVDTETRKFSVNLRDRKLFLSLAVCLLLAASGAYYAYFACFFLLIAGILAALRWTNARHLLLPGVLVAVIFGGLVVNLLPSILHLRQHGETTIVRRQAIDAEIYSFRISQLILPVSGHRLFLMNKLKAAFNQRQFINENDAASLGVIGSMGFLTLLGWLLIKKPELKRIEGDGADAVISHLSVLNLAAVMLATFGSLGALIGLVISAKIRAYNRISIYIAFFSLLTVALLVEVFSRRFVTSPRRRTAFIACLSVLLVLGVWDQTSARFTPDYAAVRAEFNSDANFVKRLQSGLSPNAMIFQLPVVPFPENPKIHKMFDYDHARGYLHSRGLRWSYGAMKGREHEIWQQQVAAKPTNELIETVALSGFEGIYLNRNGYAENPSRVEAEIEREIGQPQLMSDDGNLIFFDLRNYFQLLKEKYPPRELEARREDSLHPLMVVWSNGCSELEGSADNSFRWCSAIGELQVYNRAQRAKRVKLEMAVSTQNDAHLWINSGLLADQLSTSTTPVLFSRSISIPPGKHTINFRSDARRVLEPGDFRHLVFKINNFKMTVEE